MSKLLITKQRKDFQYLLCTGLVLGCSKERQVWSRKRSRTWWEDIVGGNFTTKEWIENFRMTEETINFLCEELHPYLPNSGAFVREPLDLNHRVAITVYWLASNAKYRTVGNLFGVGSSTVCNCVHTVCTAISEFLLPNFVTFPTGDKLHDTISGFEKVWGFPNCAGAIDGTHIPIIAPPVAHGDYLIRKGWYSIILQATCDFKYIITDINVGWPGRVHDARVFGNSEIFYKGETNDLFPNLPKKLVCQDKVINMPIVLLADAAYPLKTWLLKPFTHINNLTATQRIYNYKHSRARMTIENTFGRLKGRWRRIQKRLDTDVEFASTVVTACVVLHNICEMKHEQYEEAEVDAYEHDAVTDDEDVHAQKLSVMIWQHISLMSEKKM